MKTTPSCHPEPVEGSLRGSDPTYHRPSRRPHPHVILSLSKDLSGDLTPPAVIPAVRQHPMSSWACRRISPEIIGGPCRAHKTVRHKAKEAHRPARPTPT